MVSLEERKKPTKEMKESAPGEDGIRICFLKEACEEVKEALFLRSTQGGEITVYGLTETA